MKHFFITSLCTLASIAAFSQPASYFTADLENWTGLCECVNHPSVSWASVAGSPGGAAKGTDNANGTWYFNSPAAFNIDLSTYYGGTLKFDQKQNGSIASQTNLEDVMLVKSDGTRIVYNTSSNPSSVAWSSYAITLTETGWTYTNLAGAAVSYTDFMDFLATFAVIKIRGDYSTSTSESTWMDNVILATPPILPIELSTFTGELESNSTAVINWETLTEHNVSHFAIQKSSDLGQTFEIIGKVDASGNSTVENFYSFIDQNCTGESYYRLLVVDNDNSIAYSPVIVVKGNTVNSGGIELYPNPANTNLVINNSIVGFNYDFIVITDIYGREVNRIANADNQQYNLDLSNLAEGMYVVTLNNATTAYSASFQVVR